VTDMSDFEPVPHCACWIENWLHLIRRESVVLGLKIFHF